MISEMKREALQSLKGRWGLGIGSTILYFILNYLISIILGLIIILPFAIVFLLVVDYTTIFEGEEMGIGVGLGIVMFYLLIIIANIASYGIMAYGLTSVYVQISRRKDASLDALFEGFRGFKRMWNAAKPMFLIFLYCGIWIPVVVISIFFLLAQVGNGAGEGLGIAFLVLLIIAFIIVIIIYFSYTMTYYVMIEHPEYGVLQAMKESKAIMKGHKMDLFLLWLSFIGWAVLPIIPFLWLSFMGWNVLAMFIFGIGFFLLCPYFLTTTAHFYQHISNKEL
ncbi:hypothetical protein COE80_15005 [Bacillus pseudomycoides]|uniref:DUF975 family protein n=1 Tax=Bacillus pseudomycoides TaxID=64104 RepID=UPI000BFE1E7C|nr:DUF975 family protein [Bacillus pseudomycoides]PHB25933.1 hypothetical protein COE80_15005 [Bacillus pseudomycoides]